MHRRTFLQSSFAIPAAVTRRHALAQTPEASPAGTIAPFETATINGVDLAFRIAGNGDPLIMIMGYAGTMDMWDPTMQAALEASYRVITVDNRGIGSSGPTADYPFSQLADDIVGLMDTLDLDTANVFGWSMGSMIGNDLAVRHGHRLRRIVLHAGDAGGPDAVAPKSSVSRDLDMTGQTVEEQVETTIRLMIPDDFAADHRDDLVAVLSRPSGPVTEEALRQQTDALMTRYQAPQPVEDIDVPAMILHGNDDRVIPVANAAPLADRIPNAWLVRIPGGHGVIYQDPGTIAALTTTFLASDIA